MEVPPIAPRLLERALSLIDHCLVAGRPDWLLDALDELALEHGEDFDELARTLFERLRAYMVVTLRAPVSCVVHSTAAGMHIPAACIHAAAVLPLTARGNFDPRDFLRAVLIVWRAEGRA